ncbi:hypothetical protein [Flavobacterium sp.]|uniref:hypothetical protein n=1 Tax=Flavobacterium sp. TaxID=239 RepID=UPI0040476E33
MKKNLKLLSLALVAALYFTSCENDSNTKPVEQSADLENTWETHDPNLIAKIDAEIDEKIATSKASTTIYRNFRLIVDANTPSDIIALAKQEIDQMYASGMKATTLAKMDNVTGIYLAPTGSRGMYYSNGRVVINDYTTYRRVKQSTSGVVPHELTHYYHDRHLSGGFGNSTVNSLYNNARANRIYPSSAYVLSNRVEYLGTSVEAYFSGTSRPPYNRNYLSQQDPNLRNFINANF